MSAPNISLLGATYNSVAGVTLPKNGGGTATFPWVEGSQNITSNNTYDVTNLAQVVVNVSGGGGGGEYAWFGDGAEKVATVISKSINLKNDTTYDSWSASTTETNIKAQSSNADYTLSNASGDYDYCFLAKGFCQPVYLAGTTLKKTTYRICYYSLYAIFGEPDKDNLSAMTTGSPISGVVPYSCYGWGYKYYDNNGNLATYRSIYAPAYMANTPTCTNSVSSGLITVAYKIPPLKARCNSSRFATSMKTNVDSAKTNFELTVDLIRCPRGKGFGSTQWAEMITRLNA